MNGLSFREFLQLEKGENCEVIGLKELLTNHVELSKNIVSCIEPRAYFDAYLEHGY